MRSVSLLLVLGACLTQGRGLKSEDTIGDLGSDIGERDDGFFVVQHPSYRSDDILDGKNSLDSDPNAVDDHFDELLLGQNPGSEDEDSDIHPIFKRDFVTFTERFTTPATVTRVLSLSFSFTQGSAEFVTVTDQTADPLTVTSVSYIGRTTTQVFTEGGPVYQITAPPADATEEFLTSTYVVETVVRTVTALRGAVALFTVTRPPTVTVTARPTTVTITESFTYTRLIRQTLSLPVVTRNIVLPGCCACPATAPAPTTTSIPSYGYGYKKQI